ncbi:MAG: hypothetical protein AB7F40_07705 [Victivallaceae bacterium]|nr:hypothetical protein [Victivallaceae bacterium]
MKTEGRRFLFAALAAATVIPAFAEDTLVAGNQVPDSKIQKIRFVEDDAQNYMVSKVYELKHQKANDVVPFLLGAIKRYAKNGSADRINYSAGNKQLVAVSCPVPLMPYIDDMVAKLDHPGAKGPDGSGIDGTGIIRSVYTPVWRSSETMMNIMIKAGIPSNATEGANQDAVVAFDAATNRIYWKDSINKDKDMKKYLAWLDRPVPQCNISINVYELREGDLLDLGLDYLAWKNGPGLNLFDAGAAYLDGSALDQAFGPYGFFMFAPSFDLSFVRMLQQNGRARLATSAMLTVSTGHDAYLKFTPTYQNLVKNDKFATSVVGSSNDNLSLSIVSPVISLSGKTDAKTGQLGYSEQDYAEQSAIVNFSYTLDIKSVVDRDTHGNELYDASSTSGAVTVKGGGERMLARYVQESETEQTIGVPFLCELPVLKYIFGTTTRNKEKVFFFVSVKSELVHPDAEIAAITGKLISVPELVNNQTEVQ